MNSTKDAKISAVLVRGLIEKALAQIVRDHPEIVSSITMKTMRYGLNNATSALEITWADGISPDAQRYQDHLFEWEGLPALNATFPYKNHTYQIIGMKKGGKVIVRNDEGKEYLIKPVDLMKTLHPAPKIG